MDRSLIKLLKRRTEKELRGKLHRLPAEEAAVLALLQRRMEQELAGGRKPRARKHRRPLTSRPRTKKRETTS